MQHAHTLLKIHKPPLVRAGSCETHGAYDSLCHLRGVWLGCPACEQAEKVASEKKKAEDLAQERAAAWQARIGRAGIPDRFLDRSLKSFVASTHEQRVALDFAVSYAEQFEEVRRTGRSAIFIGMPGTGKTHLACGIGMHVIEHFGADVLFITVQRAIRSVKDTWTKGAAQSESEAVATLVGPDLLVLDEVGVQNGTDFERNTLFDVINERYERRKPTLYLSNLPKDELTTYLGARVMDRVREDGGLVVPFTWESHRGRGRL